MTMKWSFSYNFFVKFSLYNLFTYNWVHSYRPQTSSYKETALYVPLPLDMST